MAPKQSLGKEVATSKAAVTASPAINDLKPVGLLSS